MENKEGQEEIIQNLRDAGCNDSVIADYLKYDECKCCNMLLCILNKQRNKLLENIHKEQKKLDCLDYLIYKIKGGPRCG